MHMLEKGDKALDKEDFICAIFMDLSKAFDRLNYNVLFAKLGSDEFETKALYYININTT